MKLYTGTEEKLLAGDRAERITPLLLFSCMVAASGGLLVGYEHGVSGGVTSMDSFLKEFFPGVYAEMKEDHKTSTYCKFNSQLLTLFTSSIFFAGLLASPFAAYATTKFGRRFSMRVGGVFCLAGALLGSAANNIYMLILSRVLLGFGDGFTRQSLSLYISEMAPAKYRGAIFNFHHICLTCSGLMANVVNYGSHKTEAAWAWRISLGAAVLPAVFLSVGSLFIPETPTSLIQRGGDLREVSHLLRKLRGTSEIDGELDQLIAAAAEAPTSASAGLRPLRRIFQRKYRPQLVMALALTFFQHLTGTRLVGFYAPLMFRTIGLKESVSLLSAFVMKLTSTVSILAATPFVDRLGRRAFFFVGGLELFVSLVTAGGIMAAKLGDHGGMSGEYSLLMLAVFCLFVSGNAWSWGPLPTLVTSEFFPLEIRSTGRSIVVATGFLLSALLAQGMLFMLCHLKWGIFFFFAGWMVVMTLFVFFFLPETKGLNLNEMGRVWKEHWYWKRFVEEEGEEDQRLLGVN